MRGSAPSRARRRARRLVEAEQQDVVVVVQDGERGPRNLERERTRERGELVRVLRLAGAVADDDERLGNASDVRLAPEPPRKSRTRPASPRTVTFV